MRGMKFQAMKAAEPAVFVVSAYILTENSRLKAHHSYMMKTLFKRYRERVRIIRDAEGVVLKKECGGLAAGGARFESEDVAMEYIRSSKLVTI